MPLVGPEPLSADHDLDSFNCGRESLNSWLRETARSSEARGNARTYVCLEQGSDRVVAYHSLAAGSVSRNRARGALARNSPDHVPVVVLARLAVDLDYQGSGLGSFLMLDAIDRASSAAEGIGARALIVNPIDERAAAWYEASGFKQSRDATLLYLMMTDARAFLES